MLLMQPKDEQFNEEFRRNYVDPCSVEEHKILNALKDIVDEDSRIKVVCGDLDHLIAKRLNQEERKAFKGLLVSKIPTKKDYVRSC